MIAVGFLGIGGALRPAHGEIREADRGNIGKIVNGIIEQRDRVAEDAADDFGSDEAKRGDHGPAEDRRTQRWVDMAVIRVAAVAVTVGMRMGERRCFFGRAGRAIVIMPVIVRMIVGVLVRMSVHRPDIYSTRTGGLGVLRATAKCTNARSGHLDTRRARFR